MELKNELIAHGYIFKTHCDTEVILAAYDYWGKDCLQHFNGMWALAIWDYNKQHCFLARDRFGKKPLFYAFVRDKSGNKVLIFASEMKAIYPYLQELKPNKHFQDMSNSLVYEYEGKKECLIDGIYRFPSSHYAYYTADSKDLECHRYYNILDNLPQPPKNYKEAVEIFRHLFLDSVALRMRSDVPIGTALSGGLDSSATLCAMHYLANQQTIQSKNWQHAFIACFKDTSQDEREYAKKVVDYTGIEANFVEINPLQNWDKIEEYFYLFEDMYVTNPIPMITIYRAVKQAGVSVTLDGHGADELFSGYGHLIWGAWDNKYNPKISYDFFKTENDTKQYPLSPKELRSQYYRFMRKQAKQNVKNFLKGKKKIYPSIYNDHPNFKNFECLNKELFILFYETVLPTLLRNYDRYSMINSVEIRMPFMDHRLVEFAFSLPSVYKIGGGYTKRIIRDSVCDFMPESITWRKSKIGFSSPLSDWIRRDRTQNGLKEWFLDIIYSKDFLECPLIRTVGYRGLILWYATTLIRGSILNMPISIKMGWCGWLSTINCLRLHILKITVCRQVLFMTWIFLKRVGLRR